MNVFFALGHEPKESAILIQKIFKIYENGKETTPTNK